MTPEQIAERKSGIGGSDLACVLGLSPWRSPVDVWLEKTGQNAVAVEETPAMYWGSQLEELVADLRGKANSFFKNCSHVIGRSAGRSRS